MADEKEPYDWADTWLMEDEIPLVNRRPDIDILLYRLAHLRSRYIPMMERQSKERGPLETHPVSEEEWARMKKENPGLAEDERLGNECEARGGCDWSDPKQPDAFTFGSVPYRECAHCGSSVSARYDKIEVPE